MFVESEMLIIFHDNIITQKTNIYNTLRCHSKINPPDKTNSSANA